MNTAAIANKLKTLVRLIDQERQLAKRAQALRAKITKITESNRGYYTSVTLPVVSAQTT